MTDERQGRREKYLDSEELQAYFDGEIRDGERLAYWESIVRDKEEAQEQLRLYDILRTQLRGLPKTEAPPYLRARVSGILVGRARRRRRTRWAALVAAVMVIVGAGVFWEGYDASRGDTASIYLSMVEDHAASAQGSAMVGAAGSDADRLEGWFAERLDFKPVIPRWRWAEVRGGRPYVVEGYRVAFVRYHCGGQAMSLFIWPREKLPEVREVGSSARPRIVEVSPAYSIALWSEGSCAYGLVGPGPMVARVSDRFGAI